MVQPQLCMSAPLRGYTGAAGVLLNALFPVWIITFLLVAMLVFLTWKTGEKGLQLFRREQRAARRRAERAAATGGVPRVISALLSRWPVAPDGGCCSASLLCSAAGQWSMIAGYSGCITTPHLRQPHCSCSPAVSPDASRLQPSRPAQAAASHMTRFALSADVEAPQSPSPTHADHHDPFLSGASTPVAGAPPAGRQLQGPGLHGRQGPPPLEMAAAAQRFALSAQQAGAGSRQGSASPDADHQRNNQGGGVDTSAASAPTMAGAGHAALASSQLRRRISDSTGGQQQEVSALPVRDAVQSPSTSPGQS